MSDGVRTCSGNMRAVGTVENSPVIYRWVTGGALFSASPVGTTDHGGSTGGRRSSIVPTALRGKWGMGLRIPSVENAGLFSHRPYGTNRTTTRAAPMSRQVDTLGHHVDTIAQQIDHLVYDLYGLTAAEIKIVERDRSEGAYSSFFFRHFAFGGNDSEPSPDSATFSRPYGTGWTCEADDSQDWRPGLLSTAPDGAENASRSLSSCHSRMSPVHPLYLVWDAPTSGRGPGHTSHGGVVCGRRRLWAGGSQGLGRMRQEASCGCPLRAPCGKAECSLFCPS